jgi:hypothetical protein
LRTCACWSCIFFNHTFIRLMCICTGKKNKLSSFKQIKHGLLLASSV